MDISKIVSLVTHAILFIYVHARRVKHADEQTAVASFTMSSYRNQVAREWGRVKLI